MKLSPVKRGKWHFRGSKNKNSQGGTACLQNPLAARTFRLTFSPVRTPQKMHATPLYLRYMYNFVVSFIYYNITWHSYLLWPVKKNATMDRGINLYE